MTKNIASNAVELYSEKGKRAPLNLTKYHVQYRFVDVQMIEQAGLQLLITEGSPFGHPPELSDQEVQSLQDNGTLVAGYVNVSIVDDARPYWNPDWTHDGTDLGKPVPEAPIWLHSGRRNSFGIIVNFHNADWHDLVIRQARELVRRGYRAIFLDDVGRYHDPENSDAEEAVWARRMMFLVSRIDRALRSRVAIIVNGAPYIVNDAQRFPGSRTYLKIVDGLMVECLFGLCGSFDEPALVRAKSDFGRHAKLLALEHSKPSLVPEYYRKARSMGFVPSWSQDGAYNTDPI